MAHVAAATRGGTNRRSISRPRGTRDSPFAIDCRPSSRPAEPAAMPIEPAKSGKRPLTAPHGRPIPSAASQEPTITRSRATPATMRGRPDRSTRVRMVAATKIGATRAVAPSSDETRKVMVGLVCSHRKPPMAGPAGHAAVRGQGQPAERRAACMRRGRPGHVGAVGRQEERGRQPGEHGPYVERQQAAGGRSPGSAQG